MDQINPAQGRILFVLWQEDLLPISELAKRTSFGKSTLTSMLNRLEKADYLQRVPSAEDCRVITVKRTMKNEAFRRAFLDLSAEMTEEWYQGFKKSETHSARCFLALIGIPPKANSTRPYPADKRVSLIYCYSAIQRHIYKVRFIHDPTPLRA